MYRWIIQSVHCNCTTVSSSRIFSRRVHCESPGTSDACSVDFSRKINHRGEYSNWTALHINPGLQINFFSRDPLESRPQCGFGQNGLCKILFSKNLDTKILITHDLGTRFLDPPNRHGLDDDRAVLSCGARSDVTMSLWKTAERGRLRPDTPGPPDSREPALSL